MDESGTYLRPDKSQQTLLGDLNLRPYGRGADALPILCSLEEDETSGQRFFTRPKSPKTGLDWDLYYRLPRTMRPLLLCNSQTIDENPAKTLRLRSPKQLFPS